MNKNERRQFLRVAPKPAQRRILDTLQKAGNHNNIVAYQVQRELHPIISSPDIWRMSSPQIRMEIERFRSLAFDGFFPLQQDFDRLQSALSKESSPVLITELQRVVTHIQDIIEEQRTMWRPLLDTYRDSDLVQILQDTTVAFHHVPDSAGERILSFGSARVGTGTPVFDATRWINKTLVRGTLSADGSSEQVITGAGPGVMQAANLGAMEGRWEILQSLQHKLETADCESRTSIEQQLRTARAQLHSIGIRIALPFEASWNEYLQLGLTIKNFAPRKGGLIAATTGRSILHAENQSNGYRHPAIFAFPGGFGTEDELWEAACLIQCQKMPNTPIFTVGNAAQEKVEKGYEVMERWGAINPDDKGIIRFCTDEVQAVEMYHEEYDMELSSYTKKAIQSRKPSINKQNSNRSNGYRS